MDAGGNNRYELLFMDEDAENKVQTPVEVQKTAPQKPATTKKPNVQAGKENKTVASNKENANKKAVPNANAKPSAPVGATKGPRDRPPQAGTNSSGTFAERRNVNFKQDNNEVREQRNNRRNLRNDEFGNAGAAQRPFRENRGDRGNFRNRDGNFRGKREFDRQSGSDKTGVKAVDKRDGAGAHNWGSVKQEIENVDIAVADGDATLTDKEENEAAETSGEAVAVPEEETAKEMTLDEYKALRQQREKPKYNIRKPGEGEDTAQWKKMVVLSKKKDPDSEEEFEYDPAMYPQRVGRLQRIVDIQFNFKDGRRGGGNFGGRGGPRGPRGEKGGRFERGDRNENAGGRFDRGDRNENAGGRFDRGDRNENAGGRFDRGDRNENAGGRFDRGDRNENAGGRNESDKPRNFGNRQQKSGIKVDYESQFPTLG